MFVESIVKGVARFGDRPVIVATSGWSISFRDLDRLTDEAAVGLAARGISAGDVVALALPSTADYLIAYGALAKLGAITGGINPKLAPPERSTLVTHVAHADYVIATSALADGMSIECPLIEVGVATHPEALLAAVRAIGEAPPRLPHDPSRLVAMCFTSGTTGLPKAAVFTDEALRVNAALDKGNGWGEGGPITGNTQYCHVGFMAKVPGQFAAGTTYHVIEPWQSSTVLDALARHRMPAVGGVAPQIALLLRDPNFDSYDLTSVELIVCGGAPASSALITEARSRFQSNWTQRYSCTETGGVGCFTWIDAPEEEMLFTVGRPRPGIELEIRDGDDRRSAVGEIGEVCFRHAAMMKEYWRNPSATASALRGGWMHTGDEGYIDDRGCCRLVGRRGEAFSRGGYIVFPKETENVLSWHPKVAHVAVVPRPNDVMGSIGVAVVVPRVAGDPPSLSELRDFGARHLAKFKLPEALRVVDTMPMTAMLKIDRNALTQHESDVAADHML